MSRLNLAEISRSPALQGVVNMQNVADVVAQQIGERTRTLRSCTAKALTRIYTSMYLVRSSCYTCTHLRILPFVLRAALAFITT